MQNNRELHKKCHHKTVEEKAPSPYVAVSSIKIPSLSKCIKSSPPRNENLKQPGIGQSNIADLELKSFCNVVKHGLLL